MTLESDAIYYPRTFQLNNSDDTSFFSELFDRFMRGTREAQDLTARILEEVITDKYGIDCGDTGIKLREIVCEITRKNPKDLTHMVKIDELKRGIQNIIEDYRSGKSRDLKIFITRLGDYCKSRTILLAREGAGNDLFESLGEVSQYTLNNLHQTYMAEKFADARNAVDMLLAA